MSTSKEEDSKKEYDDEKVNIQLPTINDCIRTPLNNRLFDNDIVNICNKIIENIGINKTIPNNNNNNKIMTLYYITTRHGLFQNLKKYIRRIGNDNNKKIDRDGLITRWIFSQQL